jgi:hypothetical protein
MQFFDDKQEVMDVVITPFGKYLLSRGQFKPEYYGFFDEGILYDSQWVTGSTTKEVQNEIEGRIQEQTPRIKQPSTRTGVATSIDIRNNLIRANITPFSSASYLAQDTDSQKIYNQEALQITGDKFDFLETPLGRSAQDSFHLPAWNISMLRGTVTGSQGFLLLPSSSTQNIPQIDINLNYKVYVSQIGAMDDWTTEDVTVDYGNTTFPVPSLATIANPDVGDVFPPGTVESIASQIYGDGTYFSIENGKIILEITEENVDFKKENFDIQVFMSSSAASHPLGDQRFFTNNILDPEIDSVEKYLTIRTDKEIDDARVTPSSMIQGNSLVTDSSTTNVISTREFLVRDLYDPEPDVCE